MFSWGGIFFIELHGVETFVTPKINPVGGVDNHELTRRPEQKDAFSWPVSGGW